ncbi:MAG: hypothetical protein IKE36_04360 [Solobacterium sp.]|nr:hypothetical protein [Solobacterium sp.]
MVKINVEEMSERALLEELVEQNRKEETFRMIRFGFNAVILVVILALCIIYVPKIINELQTINKMFVIVNDEMEQIRSVVESVDLSKIDDLAGLLEKLQELAEMFPFSGLFH